MPSDTWAARCRTIARMLPVLALWVRQKNLWIDPGSGSSERGAHGRDGATIWRRALQAGLTTPLGERANGVRVHSG